jgi:hypothetical protein
VAASRLVSFILPNRLEAAPMTHASRRKTTVRHEGGCEL